MTEEEVQPIVDFDVALEERNAQERLSKLEAYKIQLPAGTVVYMENARKLDWAILVQLGQDPIEFISYVVPDEEQQKALIETRMSSETMRMLMRRYYEHYGITNDMLTTGNADTTEHLQFINRKKRRSRR